MSDGSAPLSVIWRLRVNQPGEQSRAAPCWARISHYSPLPLLARQPSRLLARDSIFGFGRPLLPTLCHYAAQNEKTASRDSRRLESREDGGKCASLALHFVCLQVPHSRRLQPTLA